MRELGADEHGRISYQEFLRRRLALRPEIEALRSGRHRTSSHHTHTPEYLPTSSDNSLGEPIAPLISPLKWTPSYARWERALTRLSGVDDSQ